jgi:hypothetical protein
MDNNWRKKVLSEYKKEIELSGRFFAIFSLIILLGHFLAGYNFEWQKIDFISAPNIWDLYFYETLSYCTVGAFLFYIVRYWKILKFICVDLFDSWKLYNEAKRISKAFIILFTMYVTPKLFDFLNSLFSFIYNILSLALYLFPILGITSIIFIISLLYNKDNKPLITQFFKKPNNESIKALYKGFKL